MTPEQLANKLIKMLKDYGYTYDEMPAVFELARKKLEQLKNNNKPKNLHK